MGLLLQPKSAALRQALDHMMESEPDVARHPELVEHLRSAHPHTIEVAVDPYVSHLPLDRYNCYAYALGLAESTAVSRISRMFDRTTWLNGDFIDYLLARYLQEIAPDDARDGDLLVYSNERETAHAGIVAGGRLVSKWGIGQLWSHGPWEVPLQYGATVRLCRRAESRLSEQAFITYAKEREGADLVADLLGERDDSSVA